MKKLNLKLSLQIGRFVVPEIHYFPSHQSSYLIFIYIFYILVEIIHALDDEID